ncbi:MAG: hypothetical protein WCF84_18735 [Anaerolineae bacterium]
MQFKIYLVSDTGTAIADNEESAQHLIRAGYRKCTRAEYQQKRQEQGSVDAHDAEQGGKEN